MTSKELENFAKIRIGLVNTYMQGREVLIPSGEYPSHHLWGADKLTANKFSLVIIPPAGTRFHNRIAKFLTNITRTRFGDLDQEIEIWRRRKEIDIVYVANGALFWLILLHLLGIFHPKIVRWCYIPRKSFAWWNLRDISSRPIFFRGTDLLLCLTHRAADAYKREMPWLKIRQIDWGADPIRFSPGIKNGDFFFACGRTNRDYHSLLQSAGLIKASVHLVVNKSSFGNLNLPPNVIVGGGTTDLGTDNGMPYSSLIHNYFHKARAILIPLKSSTDDSAGMTNLLEGMACGLPVVMTRTGALDINIEELGVGLYVEPGKSRGWADACNWLIDNPTKAHAMGNRGRKIVETHYNTDRLGSELSEIFNELF